MTSADRAPLRSPHRSPSRAASPTGEDLAWASVPLSEEQVAAATAPLQPGLIVAGAGTGKTTVMAARMAWLVHIGAVPADGILGLTFTNKAAGELLDRARSSLAAADAHRHGDCDPADSEELAEPTVSTYNAFAGRLIGEFGILIGIEPSTRLLTEVGRYQVAHTVAVRLAPPPEVEVNTLTTATRRILALDGALADNAIEPNRLSEWDERLIEALGASDQQVIGREMLATARERRWLVEAVQEFRRAKVRAHVLDFSDQVRLALDIVERRSDVVETLRARHPAVLLDEYQDTSIAQRRMLQRLFGRGHAVTAVGDPCQAIYGWRGASSVNIDMFPHHFPAAGPRPGQPPRPAPVFQLTSNRRSDSVILDCGNAVADRLRRVHPVVPHLVPADATAPSGTLEVGLVETVDQERNWVVERIAELGTSGSTPWRDIAVLCRTNEPINDLAARLNARGVPAQVLARSTLLDRPEVIDVICALTIVADPSDNVAVLRLLSGPRWRLGLADLAALARTAATRNRADRAVIGDVPAVAGDPSEVLAALAFDADGDDRWSLWDVIAEDRPADLAEVSGEARDRLAVLRRLVRKWQQVAHLSIPDMVGMVVSDLGLAAHLSVVSEDETPLLGLRALTDLARTFDALDGRRTLTGFLAYLADARRLEVGVEVPAPRRGDAVTLMTVHGSKGLEFPVVFLPDLVDVTRGRGRWPKDPTVPPHAVIDEPVPAELSDFPPDPSAPRAKEHNAYLEACRAVDLLEETRLAYVAVTRAKHHLVATGHRWSRTRAKPLAASPFLEAIREVALAGGGTPFAWEDLPEKGAVNPLLDCAAPGPAWLQDGVSSITERQREAAALVREAMKAAAQAPAAQPPPADAESRDAGLTAEEVALVAEWDRDLAIVRRRIGEAAGPPMVALPPELATTTLSRLAADPEGLARDLLRPMPRRPSQDARKGTDFHSWVESLSGQQSLWEVDELPGAADPPVVSVPLAWRRAFLESPYGDRHPMVVEHACEIDLDGYRVRGRIDAVYRDAAGWEIVDWKTGSLSGADPLQLAAYRAAWAAEQGVDPRSVRAAFVFVDRREWHTYEDLPGQTDLADLVAGRAARLGIPDPVVRRW